MLKAIIARRLRLAREEASLTQGQLAEALNLSRGAITALENGRSTLLLEHLEMLPGILNKPVSYFLDIDPGLTDDEARLLAVYRSLPADQHRQYAIDLILAWANQSRDWRPS